MVIDIVGFGGLDDPAQLRARHVLRQAVRTAFRAARIRPVVEDRGDGVVVIVPAFVSKVDLLDPVVPTLVAGVRGHVRVRVAIHAGEVHRDAYGWVGADVNTAFRLVDSEPARDALRRAPHADLVLVVSETIYRGVVRHGYRGVDPATYSPVRVAVKEVDERAWLHLLPDNVVPIASVTAG